MFKPFSKPGNPDGFPKSCPVSCRIWGNHPCQTRDWFQARSTLKARHAGESRLGTRHFINPVGMRHPRREGSFPHFPLETTMSFKSNPSEQEVKLRKQFHAIFNDWLSAAGEDEYQQLEQAREQFAPNQVCSAIRLVRGCLADPALVTQLPASLRQLLQERHWPQACADARAA